MTLRSGVIALVLGLVGCFRSLRTAPADAFTEQGNGPVDAVDATGDIIDGPDGMNALDGNFDTRDASDGNLDTRDASDSAVQVSSPCKTTDDCSAIGGGYLCLTGLSQEGLQYPNGYCTRACDLATEANGCRGLAETNCFATSQGYYCFKQCNPNSPICEPGLTCRGVYDPGTSTYGPPFLCY